MEAVPLYKQILSYIYPVVVRKGSSTKNSVLELLLFRGQYQLGTDDALYSDGARYTPLNTAFREIRSDLPRVGNVLVLGTGLGSAVQILDKQGFHPVFTLVENDVVVLNWAVELMPERLKQHIKPVCEDAKVFMDQSNGLYDLIIVDVFTNRVVPGFVTSTDFLKKCRRSTSPGGHLVLNYIVNSRKEWETFFSNLNSEFPSNRIIDHGINKIIIAQV